MIISTTKSNTTTMSSFQYTNCKGEWMYILKAPVECDEVVREAFLGVVCTTFNPEKYKVVLTLLLRQYLENNGEPVKILEAYLAFMTQGQFGGMNLADARFAAEALSTVSIMQEMWLDFGFDTVILYNAMLLKKRVLVVGGDSLQKLLDTIRTLPQFVSHRQDWSILRPLVLETSQVQVAELANLGVFVAGTMDARLTSHKSLKYDVVVSLAEKRITIATDSTSDLKMCGFHKEAASTLVQITNTENVDAANTTSEDIVLKLQDYTQKALHQIQSLGEQGVADLNNASTSQWLQRLAAAEGLFSAEASI